MKTNKLASFILLLIVLASCATEKDHLVTIKTRYGDMKMILYDQTPKHKENFLKLADEGLYDSTTFHRVIEGFMIQGGDVNAKENVEEKITYTVEAEFNDSLIHEKGAVAAARLGDQQNPEQASSGSQFYIVHGTKFTREELQQMTEGQYQYELQRLFGQLLQKEEYADLKEEVIALQRAGAMDSIMLKVIAYEDTLIEEFGKPETKQWTAQQLDAYSTAGGAPHLDETYTVFGKIIDGLPVIDSIASVQTGPGDKPQEDIYMTVEVEEVPKKKITNMYGYEYPGNK